MNKVKLYDDLIESFANYQYRLENPIPSATETREVIINHYRSDHIFNSKVQSIVAHVMYLVEKQLADNSER